MRILVFELTAPRIYPLKFRIPASFDVTIWIIVRFLTTAVNFVSE